MSDTKVNPRQKTLNSKRRQDDSESGIAAAIMFFTVSIILHFNPTYFGLLTKAVSIGFIVVGFMGLGLELNKIATRRPRISRTVGEKHGVFDNIGIGIGLLIIWLALGHYHRFIIVSILVSPLLLFGVYGTILGLVNAVVIMSRKSDSTTGNDRDTQRWQRFPARKFIAAFAGIIGFIASVIQILQFFDLV